MPLSEGPDSPTAIPSTGEMSNHLSGQADSFGFEEQQLVDLAAGSDLGGVTIIRLLAEGGMGRVYEGLQQSPVRPVAVKVLRDGLASRTMMRRFEQEAHLLARLRHPHIAQVHTLGTYRHGNGCVPFFVMELVEAALPIDRFVREKGLTVRQRVALLRRVAAAVAYGHRMGIVHRDLKPGNILVGSDGEPKVIDFGVARSTDADLALTTLQTDAGQLVGTLRYMSPEQFDADASRINAQTDVYALGLVLHELLTGDLPYEVRGKPIVVAARIIREQESQAATLISRGLAAEKDVAAVEVRRLGAITEKCLHKQPASRYATADDLEMELVRWLAGEPVLARPATLTEQTRRWMWRHRLPVAAAALVCLAGMIAIFFSGRARHQELEAQRSRMGEREESYYSAVQRAAAAAGRRNVRIAAGLVDRARSLDAVPGRPIELECLAAALDDSVAKLDGHTTIVRAVAATPAGERLMTGDDQGIVRIWTLDDAGAYRASHLLHGHSAAIWSVVIGPDGRRAVTTAEDGTCIIWNLEAGAVHGRLSGQHSAAVYGAAWAADGRSIATASGDGTVCIWNAETSEMSAVFRPEWQPTARDRNVYGVAFSAEGGQLAAACGDGSIRRWDIETGSPLPDFRGHSRRVFAVCFSPDGSRLASASEDGTARLWDVVSGLVTGTLRHPLRVNGVAWTADGSRLATVSADAINRLWNPATGRVERELLGHTDAVWSVASLSSDRFVTASSDTTARVWNAADRDGHVMACGSENGVGVRGMACSPDGRLMATCTAQGDVRLWNLQSYTVARDLPTHRGRVNAVDFSPASDLLATACGDGRVCLFSVADGTEIREIARHPGPAFAVTFSPDGTRIATAAAGGHAEGHETGAVRVSSVAGHDAPALTLSHPARAHAADWSPDGRRLVTACADGLVREWNTSDGTMLGAFAGHADDVNWVAYSNDGSRVATGSSDGTVRIWNPADGWSSTELKGPVGQVWEVGFSPDGTRVAGVGADGSLHLWHVASGRHLLALDGHDGPIWAVVFAADGGTLLTGSDDGTARVWGMPAAEMQRRRSARQP